MKTRSDEVVHDKEQTISVTEKERYELQKKVCPSVAPTISILFYLFIKQLTTDLILLT